MTNTESDLIVAISVAKMNSGGNPSNNPLCNTKITITNDAGVSQDATIVDTCAACAEEDIDASPALFNTFASPADGRTTVSWSGPAVGQ